LLPIINGDPNILNKAFSTFLEHKFGIKPHSMQL